ncbi:MAG: hypothetical protein KF862_19555 [Chitinophagaceae bacterium]|nr:hypothetical protein [Chitinophagaceae bacterium]
MARFLLLAFFLFTGKLSYCQVTKQNWLVGGTGSFNSNSYTDDLGNKSYKETYLQLQPNVGFFFIDKLAAGIKLNISFLRNKVESENYNLQKSNFYGFGPFIRYYILNSENRINFLIEGSYQYQVERSGGVSANNNNPISIQMTQYTRNMLGFAGGPVMYFNRSVGLELLAGYSFTDYVQNKSNIKKFYVGIGLQVHLEKE